MIDGRRLAADEEEGHTLVDGGPQRQEELGARLSREEGHRQFIKVVKRKSQAQVRVCSPEMPEEAGTRC